MLNLIATTISEMNKMTHIVTYFSCWNSALQYVHLTTGYAPRHSCKQIRNIIHLGQTINLNIVASSVAVA